MGAPPAAGGPWTAPHRLLSEELLARLQRHRVDPPHGIALLRGELLPLGLVGGGEGGERGQGRGSGVESLEGDALRVARCERVDS